MPEAFTLNFKRGENQTYELAGTMLRQWEANSLNTKTVAMEAASSPRDGTFPNSSSPHGGSVQLVALAFVRVAQWQLAGPLASLPGDAPIFEGGKADGPAARFARQCGYASRQNPEKGSKWIAEMFPRAGAEKGGGLLLRWFLLEADGNKERCSVKCRLAEAPVVIINVNGEPVSETELDQVEISLALALHASFPHHLLRDGTVIAGKHPSIQPGWFLRKEEALQATRAYLEQTPNILAVIGGSGTGKTVFATQWLRHIIGTRRLRQGLVFSWSFNRQGAAFYIADPLTIFYRELAREVGADPGLTDSPTVLARHILGELSGKPIFLFLDGIEATFSSRSRDVPVGLATLLQGIVHKAESFVLATSWHELEAVFRLPRGATARLELGPVPAHGGRKSSGGYTTGDFLSDEQSLGEAASSSCERDERRRQAVLEADLRRTLKRVFQLSSETDLDELIEKGSAHVAAPKGYFLSMPEPRCGVRIATMLNLFLHEMRVTLGEVLLHILSVCDRPIAEGTLFSVAATLPLDALYAIKRPPSGDEWADALAFLVSTSILEQASRQELYSLHAAKRTFIVDALKEAKFSTWIAINKAMAEELLKSAVDLPSTQEEIVPLVHAGIHFCQAGLKAYAYDEIGFRRLSRGLKGYAVAHLGDYESSRGLNHALLGNAAKTEVSDLPPEAVALIIHVNALCLRFLDRLDDALREENIAWARAIETKSPMAVLPIGFNLLRLHHIFGNLVAATEVRNFLIKQFSPGKMFSVRKVLSKEERIDGSSMGTSIMALTSLCSGTPDLIVKGMLQFAMIDCKICGSRRKHLLPSYGVVWHAFALLELGQWQACERAMDTGELDSKMVRFQQTGSIELLSAKTLLCKARAFSGSIRDEALSRASEFALRALKKAEVGDYRWWKAISHLTCGQILPDAGQPQQAREHLDMAIGLSRESSFQLLLVDALIERAHWERVSRNNGAARTDGEEAKKIAARIGYGLRNGALQRVCVNL